jgi:glutamate---cysteine ligase / carboxylate-amine ligase
VSTSRRFGLFEALGVELEYMIVDARSLDVAPLSDQLLLAAAGSYVGEVAMGPISWSNELVAHVVELKTTDPAASLDGLAATFSEHVGRIDALLRPLGARLMPTGMHPWMNPDRETKLWAHECNEVYETFDRIFGCRGHGWSNLQSVHLNLPFADDEEFGRLHAAIRLLLPILPALAASSPIVQRSPSGLVDTRLEMYRANSGKIASITGRVIPEPVFTRADYERTILQRIYADIAPDDPQGVLCHEWLNARGAIARFDRGTIEIRVLDVQECPTADLAICAAALAVLRSLVEERWTSWESQKSWEVGPLASIFLATVRDGERATISDAAYLKALGCDADQPRTAGQVWRELIEPLFHSAAGDFGGLEKVWRILLEEGPLARRILRAVDLGDDLKTVYSRLCDSLARDEMFVP